MPRYFKDQIPAVVYASNTPAGFGIVRSLSDHGIPVIGLDHYSNFVRFSHKHRFKICPNPEKDPAAFIDFMVTLGKLLGKAALFASGDLPFYLFSHHRKELEPYFCYPYLDAYPLQAGLDKWVMYQAAVKAGIPCPDTLMSPSANEIRGRSWTYPVVIKPVTCQFIMSDGGPQRINDYLELNHYKKAFRAKDLNELVTTTALLSGQGFPFVIQEEIGGRVDQFYNVKIYAGKDGKVWGSLAGRKVRQMPVDFGICSLGYSEESPDAVRYAEAFVKAIGFRGIGDIEFKMDSRDGLLKFIELNPRSPQHIYQAAYAGLNLPLWQYADLTGTPLPPGAQPGLPARSSGWMKLESELSFLAKYWPNRRSPEHTTLRGWLRSVMGRPMAEAYLAWDDPIVSAIYLFKCLLQFGMKLTKNVILVWTGINVNNR